MVDFCGQRPAAARAEAVLFAARPAAVASRSDGRSAGRSGSTPSGAQPGRDPHPARRRRDARVRAAQRRLRVEFADLPALDGRHLLDPADRRGRCSCATRSSRSCGWRMRPRASARAARRRISAPRGARGAARGARFPGDEIAHRARDRAAHRDAGRRRRTTCAPS